MVLFPVARSREGSVVDGLRWVGCSTRPSSLQSVLKSEDVVVKLACKVKFREDTNLFAVDIPGTVLHRWQKMSSHSQIALPFTSDQQALATSGQPAVDAHLACGFAQSTRLQLSYSVHFSAHPAEAGTRFILFMFAIAYSCVHCFLKGQETLTLVNATAPLPILKSPCLHTPDRYHVCYKNVVNRAVFEHSNGSGCER